MQLCRKLFAVFFLLLAMPNTAPADQTTMRCGGKIVQTGDSMFKVMRTCGEPATRAVVGERKIWDAAKDRSSYRGSSITVTVERWTYDMGRYRFPRILTFYGDKLAKIELGDMY